MYLEFLLLICVTRATHVPKGRGHWLDQLSQDGKASEAPVQVNWSQSGLPYQLKKLQQGTRLSKISEDVSVGRRMPKIRKNVSTFVR